MEPDGVRRYTPTLENSSIVRCVLLDQALSQHIGDAITNLVNDDEWLEDGSTVADVVDAAAVAVESFYNDMLIGSVVPWIIDVPGGWLLLDGSTYALADYPELADVLPAHLKSGPNFILPDVLDSFPYGVDDSIDSAIVAGDNDIVLTVGQLPAHSHTYTPPVLTVDAETPVVPIPTAGIGAPTATGTTGSGDNIDIRPQRFGLLWSVYAGRV